MVKHRNILNTRDANLNLWNKYMGNVILYIHRAYRPKTYARASERDENSGKKQ